MIALVGHYNEAFLYARPTVDEVMDVNALLMADAWDDLFDCWCGCPL